MPKHQFQDESDDEEEPKNADEVQEGEKLNVKKFKSIEPLDDKYEITIVADNINGLGIGGYMSKYLT